MSIDRDVLAHDVSMERQHVIILGAGASRAAFPDGDRDGVRLPLMNDLVDMAELMPILAKYGIQYSGGNFEDLYSGIRADPVLADLAADIENAVHSYFARMQLPDRPTLYDHLVLSLRSKDVIATFNWDPFLVQACARSLGHANIPNVLFLHGNVAIGLCREHRTSGRYPGHCGSCGVPYSPTRLLYPTSQKDYNSDPYIHGQWSNLKYALRSAYLLTIFGYSAPTSDIEARILMEQAWGTSEEREYEQIELIDVKSEDALTATWSSFIHSHHYQVVPSFYESISARYPRRSCEAMWRQLMDVQWVAEASLPWEDDFHDLHSAVGQLTRYE